MSEAPLQLYSIPPTGSFVDRLAQGCLQRWGEDPLGLSAVTILLPNRRACRSLGEAFLRLSAGRSLVLPRLQPLGDLDPEEMALGAEESLIADSVLADLPPAMPALKRLLLLSRLIQEWAKVSPASGSGSPPHAEHTAVLALELARLIDQVETEGLNFDGLEGLVPEDYAEHWQVVLQFLRIVTEHWPALEKDEGTLGQAARRRLLLQARASLWQQDPPQTPIIIAGSTGSIPATAELMAVVARLPQGLVVLPGLDRSTDDEVWPLIADDPDHPQHGLACLLQRLGVSRSDVMDWPLSSTDSLRACRNRVVNSALLPAKATDSWRQFADQIDSPEVVAAFGAVRRIDCPGVGEEALAIALLLREALEQPEKRAALVTPDRILARRVAAELRRWGIEVDDSAGLPLGDTLPGGFLRLTAEMAAERFAPLPLLAALKHPLAAAGQDVGSFRAQVRALEIAILRGLRPAPGLQGLRQALARAGAAKELSVWFDALAARLAPFAIALADPDSDFATILHAHIAQAEALAASDRDDGATRLWGHEAGEAAADFIADLLAAAGDGVAMSGDQYPALLATLMSQQSVRPHFGRHPRLAIWGPLEARLQSVDLMILGGLNEGTWPSEADPGPWLSRPMRRDIGLPPVERKIGLQAHDFVQAFAAPEVVLTRATRLEGTPSVPSRWLLRLNALLDVLQCRQAALGSTDAAHFATWAEALDTPQSVTPQAPPAPRPPVAARPRRISVTQVETWRRDPYALYAAKILHLRSLDPLDAELGAADRGIILHKVLELFVKAYPRTLPAEPLTELLTIGEAVFQEVAVTPALRAYWWPRFCRLARWFITQETERRGDLVAAFAECSGTLTLEAPAGPFVLSAKADRIDRFADGRLAIIDYKTGTAPSSGDIELGFAPQLPLEAAIAAEGGFGPEVPAASVAELAHWRLTGGSLPGEVKRLSGDPGARGTAALAGLAALIAHFDDPATAYPAVPQADKASRFNDYAHLERLAEWSSGPGGEGSG